MTEQTPDTFDSLGLDDALLSALKEKGYTEPTAIQAGAIPIVLEGRDLMAAAQTGTGKTAGFTVPMLQLLSKGELAGSNQARALVLTPTRELAAQVAESVATYGKNLPLRSNVVFGGVKINPQMMRLRKGSDVLIATPGRLLDLYSQKAIKFDHLEVLVLDEADRMLDMGFIHDIRKILALLPKQRQTLLFSATFSPDIRQLAKTFLHDPEEVSVTPRNKTASSVKQLIHPVDKKRKAELLCKLIIDGDWQQALIFSRTKHGANKLVKQLDAAGINAAAIHGNKSQGARTKALAGFKNGSIRILVATDIAARGLDIEQMPQVVNFDLPNVPEDYVHRIGRTGRAGMEGNALSLVSADEVKQLSDIEQVIQQLLEREYVSGFEPDHELPATSLRPPRKAPRPRKPGSSDRGRSDSSRGQANAGKRSSNSRRTNSSGGGRQGQSQGQGQGQQARRQGSSSGSPRKAGGSNGSPRRPSGANGSANQKPRSGNERPPEREVDGNR